MSAEERAAWRLAARYQTTVEEGRRIRDTTFEGQLVLVSEAWADVVDAVKAEWRRIRKRTSRS